MSDMQPLETPAKLPVKRVLQPEKTSRQPSFSCNFPAGSGGGGRSRDERVHQRTDPGVY
jgi:hypothetical protein